jgi:hypothetical protein
MSFAVHASVVRPTRWCGYLLPETGNHTFRIDVDWLIKKDFASCDSQTVLLDKQGATPVIGARKDLDAPRRRKGL